MRYEILDTEGAVENVIEAEADFMAAQYPEGNYREADEQIAPVVPPEEPRLWWIDVGPTNRWAMFDQLPSTSRQQSAAPTITPTSRTSA